MGHTHDHACDHTGIGAASGLGRVFVVGIVLNLFFVAVEFAAGLMLDSAALMSDAGHNLSDVAGLGLSLLAFRLMRVRPNNKYTYGLRRGTVVAALANACLLLVAVGVILVECVQKLRAPQPVSGEMVSWIAGVGIVVNALTAWMFLRHKDRDLNVRGAYLHMVADALVSVGVVVSGLVIQWTGWVAIDPLMGLVVAGVVLWSTWGLLRSSVRLSLDGVPENIDIQDIASAITDTDAAISGVHHLHVWPLSTTEIALTAHVVVDRGADWGELRRLVKEHLREHGVGHSTLEFETPGDKCDFNK